MFYDYDDLVVGIAEILEGYDDDTLRKVWGRYVDDCGDWDGITFDDLRGDCLWLQELAHWLITNDDDDDNHKIREAMNAFFEAA